MKPLKKAQPNIPETIETIIKITFLSLRSGSVKGYTLNSLLKEMMIFQSLRHPIKDLLNDEGVRNLGCTSKSFYN
jgi:hypothetical protein